MCVYIYICVYICVCNQVNYEGNLQTRAKTLISCKTIILIITAK